jgi:DnaJ-domain-containing protein 1
VSYLLASRIALRNNGKQNLKIVQKWPCILVDIFAEADALVATVDGVKSEKERHLFNQ